MQSLDGIRGVAIILVLLFHGNVPGFQNGWLGVDIGPETERRFAAEVAKAKTVFWNGPMGVAEWESFAAGTRAVARAKLMVGTEAVADAVITATWSNDAALTTRIAPEVASRARSSPCARRR